MAGFGWNLKVGSNNHGSKRPYAPSQIACRICDHVFMSTQALIDHIESHMADDVEALSRRQHGLNLISSGVDPFANYPFHFSLSTPTRLPQARPILNQNRHNFPPFAERNPINFNGSSQNIVSSQPITAQAQLSLLARSKYVIGLQQVPVPFNVQQTQAKVMEEPCLDCTKPFLQQLEKPFSYKVGFKGNNGDNMNKYDVEMLDLTLKL